MPEDKTLPTSLSSSYIHSPTISTNKADVSTITLDGRPIIQVTYDFTDNSPDHVVSAQALNDLKLNLEAILHDLKNEIVDIHVTPVISQAIVDPYFVNPSKGWSNYNFTFENGQAVYRNNNNFTSEKLAYIKLVQGSFISVGTYFVRIEVTKLDSGNITVTDQSNKLLKEIVTTGAYGFEITVTEPTTDFITIALNNLEEDDAAIINRIYIYHVEDRASQYFNYIGELFSIGDDSGIASEAWVTNKVNNAIKASEKKLTSTINNVSALLSDHKAADNPHGITPVNIRAADREHTHTSDECGAAAIDHTHTPESIGAAPANHTHTPDECGAAPTSHRHTADECNAAAKNHTHEVSHISGISDITDHVSDTTTNPHDVTKDQIGLDLVKNYGIATIEDFKDRSTDVYVTPSGIGEYLDELFTQDSTLFYVQYAPKKILDTKVTLKPDENYKVSIKENTIYQIYLKVIEGANANCLRMYFDDIDLSTAQFNYFGTHVFGKGSDQVVHSTENSDCFYFIPQGIGNNVLKGMVQLDTTTGILSGTFQSWIGEYSASKGTSLVTNKGYPIFFNGCLDDDTSFINGTGVANLVFEHKSNRVDPPSTNDMVVELRIYELVTMNNVSTESIDTLPLLSRTTYLGKTAPLGWSREDGTKLDKSLYLPLAKKIEENKVSVTQQEYDRQISSTGICQYFVVTDTEITLPTTISDEDTCINIVKTSMQLVNTESTRNGN